MKKKLKMTSQIDQKKLFETSIQKNEVTSVIFIDNSTGNDNEIKFVTTSTDGFVKYNQLDL